MIFPLRQHILGVSLMLATASPWLQAQSADPVNISVTTEVLRSADQLPPLGLNEWGDIGAVKYSGGNLIQGGGHEPIQLRSLYRVIEAGVEGGRRYITIDGGGTSNYQLYNSGYYSGASMRAYRLLDSNGKPLPYKDTAWAEGGKLLDTTNATKVVHLGDTKVFSKRTPGLPEGGWQAPSPAEFLNPKTATPEQIEAHKKQSEELRKKCRVYYEGDMDLRMDDVVMFEKRIVMPEIEDIHPRMRSGGIVTQWALKSGSATQIAHTAPQPAAMNGGESCLLLESNDDAGVYAYKTIFGATGREDVIWYGQLEPNVTYRFEAWMRQEGMNSPKVQLTFGSANGAIGYGEKSQIGQKFEIGDQWKLYGFEFKAPDRPDGTKWLGGPVITFSGKGKLFLDNIKLQPVYEAGDADKPFVINRTILKNILESQPVTGRKGAMRIWSGLTPASMKSWLSWEMDSSLGVGRTPISVRPNQPTTLPKSLLICEATGDSPETRMVPWIIAQVTFTEAEYAALVEYLAAPFDPNKDTAQSKPHAYLRTQQRGNNQPWTDTFRELIIEFGNENWHNRANPGWIGFGRYKTIHQAGKEYGLFTRYFIDEIKRSPAWNDKVASKIHFCLGGNYGTSIGAYGQLASLANRENTYQGMAVYTGPRWELNEAGMTDLNDSGFRKTLVCGLMLQPDLEAQSKSVQEMKKQGVAVQMAAYESGPSGFDLAGKNKAGELYGKSLAMAVAAFDGWMLAAENGWSYQNYLAFAQGLKWSSHRSYAEGFRPSPGFLGLVMRNRFMSGDLLKASISNSPTEPVELKIGQGKNASLGPKPIPMIGTYAMGSASHLSIAVLSRSLDKTYPAKIRIPISKVHKITSHTLKGDPRQTNIDAMNIDIASADVPLSAFQGGILSYDIPPGSITIFDLE